MLRDNHGSGPLGVARAEIRCISSRMSLLGTKRKCWGRLTTRIANTAGDSVLAEFGSAVDAVQCAVDAQVAENPKIEALRDAYVRTEIALRRARRPGDAVFLEFRQVGANRGRSFPPPRHYP